MSSDLGKGPRKGTYSTVAASLDWIYIFSKYNDCFGIFCDENWPIKSLIFYNQIKDNFVCHFQI